MFYKLWNKYFKNALILCSHHQVLLYIHHILYNKLLQNEKLLQNAAHTKNILNCYCIMWSYKMQLCAPWMFISVRALKSTQRQVLLSVCEDTLSLTGLVNLWIGHRRYLSKRVHSVTQHEHYFILSVFASVINLFIMLTKCWSNLLVCFYLYLTYLWT